ncbi:MAG: YkgJ family cysteine cluster protein [Desulfobacterales bacterium]|nr:YkgJ family cysteine cluster protein [Desulfobacterales bacterium]MBF0398495.1 YkgJ family cysteine cluster protein [Desulfobacterales bacterium]
MNFDFTPFFEKYESIVKIADAAFERVKKEYAECVKCKIGCSDCCFALFDLSLIEALYINYHFKKKIYGKEREEILDVSNKIDRQLYKIKKEAYIDLRDGIADESKIIERLGNERVRCPLLDNENKCILYEFRPITCRFYGIPAAIDGRGVTCGMSGFEAGKNYPTVYVDIIQKKLFQISIELLNDIKSENLQAAEILIPLSMAILNDYDENYFGVKK